MNLPLDAQWRVENVQRLMSGALGGFGGIVLWGFGVAAAAALVAVSYDWAMQPAGSGAKPLVLATFLAIVAIFCFVVGSRLALNRPNARGSLLSPTAWIVLGIVLAAPVIAVSVLNPAGVKPAPAVVWLAALTFAGMCFWRAYAITHADRARAVVRRLSRCAPWAGVLLGISLAAVALFASLQSGRSGDVVRAAAFVALTPAFYAMGSSIASLTVEPAPRLRLPKWMGYLVVVGLALLLASVVILPPGS